MSYSIALDLDLDPRTDAEIAADRIGPGILTVVGPPLPQPPKQRPRGLTWEEEFKANSTPAERKAWAEENRPDRMTPERAEQQAKCKAMNLAWQALRADPAAFEVYRAKQSASQTARWTPELRASQSAAAVKAYWTPERKAEQALRAASKAKWSDPSYRAAKAKVSSKVSWTDPNYRAKQSATWTPERRAEAAERMRAMRLAQVATLKAKTA